MKGTFSLTDPKGQKEWLENTNPANQITHGENSVIEYYSIGNIPLWQGPYQNLKVSEGRTSLIPIIPGSGSTAADLIVEKIFTVAADAGSNFTVTAKSQLYKQTVSLKKKTTFSSFGSGGTGTVFKGSVSASGIDITFRGNGLIQTERTPVRAYGLHQEQLLHKILPFRGNGLLQEELYLPGTILQLQVHGIREAPALAGKI